MNEEIEKAVDDLRVARHSFAEARARAERANTEQYVAAGVFSDAQAALSSAEERLAVALDASVASSGFSRLDEPLGAFSAGISETTGVGPELRLPEEWARLKGLVIQDPDGWRSPNGRAFDDPITETEFDARVARSTVRFGSPGSPFLSPAIDAVRPKVEAALHEAVLRAVEAVPQPSSLLIRGLVRGREDELGRELVDGDPLSLAHHPFRPDDEGRCLDRAKAGNLGGCSGDANDLRHLVSAGKGGTRVDLASDVEIPAPPVRLLDDAELRAKADAVSADLAEHRSETLAEVAERLGAGQRRSCGLELPSVGAVCDLPEGHRGAHQGVVPIPGSVIETTPVEWLNRT